jgi:hypothetical protein
MVRSTKSVERDLLSKIGRSIAAWALGSCLVFGAPSARPDDKSADTGLYDVTRIWRLEPGGRADCNSIWAPPGNPNRNPIYDSLCLGLNLLSCDPAKDPCWSEFGANVDRRPAGHLQIRFTGYGIEGRESPIDWIEFELTPCRVDDTGDVCHSSSADENPIRGYIAYWHAPSPQYWGPVTGPLKPPSATETMPSTPLPVGKVRSLHGTETLADCQREWGTSREGTGLCRLEALLDCQTFVQGGRCQEAGWLLRSPESIKETVNLPGVIDPLDQLDLDLLFGELYFQELMPEDLRGGIRRLDYRIVGYASHYRGYPNLMRIDIEERHCFGDQTDAECDPAQFTADHEPTAYFIWWPADSTDKNPSIPMWLDYPDTPLAGVQ